MLTLCLTVVCCMGQLDQIVNTGRIKDTVHLVIIILIICALPQSVEVVLLYATSNIRPHIALHRGKRKFRESQRLLLAIHTRLATELCVFVKRGFDRVFGAWMLHTIEH